MDLFKGYILASGKVPHESVKTAKLLSEPPANSDYVGVLKEDLIQLDFDDEDTSSKILEIVDRYKLRCDILKTTRGVHLYFKNTDVKSQSVGKYNVIGLKCDVGLGIKNRVIPLRITRKIPQKKVVNGVETTIETLKTIEREWLQTYDELDELPVFLKPFDKRDPGLSSTETRNQTLYEYILQLQMRAFSKTEIREIIKVANTHILYEPLPDSEIDVITRDDAFSEEYFFTDKGKFLHHRFGDFMLANSNIMLIDNQVNIYTKDGVYSNNPDDFEKEMLKHIPMLKDAQRKEVYKYIALKVQKTGEFANPKYIGLKSKIFDIQTMETLEYSPRFVINNKIQVDYYPDAYNETVDKTLDKITCGDKQIRALIEEMIGYTLYRKNTMQKCFILTGGGSNGKSTFLNMVKHLLGKGNYTSLDMRELEDTFKPAELYNKLANIGDDISDKYMDNSSVFKKTVTGESFMVAKKYGQPFELESYATQIFCANELPQVNDKSHGFSRRITIIPFKAKFSKNDSDYDPFIEDKLLSDDAMEYLLKLAIDGLRRLLINREFTKTDVGAVEQEEYIMLNNNVLEWLTMDEPKIENESVGDVYLQYKIWCRENGAHPVKQSNMSKTIKSELGLRLRPRKIDGKSVRIYLQED